MTARRDVVREGARVCQRWSPRTVQLSGSERVVRLDGERRRRRRRYERRRTISDSARRRGAGRSARAVAFGDLDSGTGAGPGPGIVDQEGAPSKWRPAGRGLRDGSGGRRRGIWPRPSLDTDDLAAGEVEGDDRLFRRTGTITGVAVADERGRGVAELRTVCPETSSRGSIDSSRRSRTVPDVGTVQDGARGRRRRPRLLPATAG